MLARQPRSGAAPELAEQGDARLGAEAGSPAQRAPRKQPRTKWMLELRAQRVAALQCVELDSSESVPRVFKKTA